MKFATGRLAFSFSAIIILILLSASLRGPSIAGSGQQRPDKPKLQKSQQPREREDEQKDDDTITLGRVLVLLDVTVVDPSNKPVMDLKQDEFLITEDKLQ